MNLKGVKYIFQMIHEDLGGRVLFRLRHQHCLKGISSIQTPTETISDSTWADREKLVGLSQLNLVTISNSMCADQEEQIGT